MTWPWSWWAARRRERRELVGRLGLRPIGFMPVTLRGAKRFQQYLEESKDWGT